MRKTLLLLFLLTIPIGLLAQGNTWQTATLINNGATVSGTLDNINTEDWYKIDVPQEGHIDLVATAAGNLTFTYSNIYGFKDNDIYNRGGFSGTFTNNITYQATNTGKGVYYIKIARSGGSGSYTLKYTFTPCPLSNDPEPNNDYQHSSLLESGKTVQGRLGYCTSADVTDNEDWYKISVPEEGHIEFLVTGTENLTFTYSNVYGFKNGDIHDRGGFSGTFNDTIRYTATNVGSGTYYVKIARSGGSGGYRLYYKFTACPYANDGEPNDIFSQAKQLVDGQPLQGRLGYCNASDVTDTEDWYKITVPQEGHIALKATGSEDLTFSYSNIYFLADNDVHNRGGFNGIFTKEITYNATNYGAGTYYVNIVRGSGSGGYTLSYDFTPCPLSNDPEPNDDYQHSSLLESGKTVQGRMGYRDATDYTDNKDWYKIVVPEEGHIEFMVTGTEDLTFSYSNVYGFKNGDVYNRGGFSGTFNDTIRYTATNVGKGTYYVKIERNGGSGGYRLYYKFTECPLAGDQEPNGEYTQAQTILNGQNVTGRLGYNNSEDVTDNTDWFKIDVPRDGCVRITATATENLTFSYSNVYGIKNGDTYNRGGFSGIFSDTIRYEAKDTGKGVYYIKIARNGGSGGYRLSYEFIANNHPNDTEPNNDDEHAQRVQYGETIRGHLGYRSAEDVTDNYDIYKIDLNDFAIFLFEPDTTSTLDVYRLVLRKGNKSWSVNPGKKPATLSPTNMEPGTYYLEVARGSGCGAYTILCGNNTSDTYTSGNIKLSFEGHNSVRLGIPCEYTIRLENTSDVPSEFFFLPIMCTPDIELLGAKLPGKNGYVEELPLDSIGNAGDSIMWFVVPPMAPHETYSFQLLAQGLVMPRTSIIKAPNDIALVTGSAIVIAGLIAYNVAVDYAGDEVIGFCTEVINERIDLTEEELDLYRHKNPKVYQDMVNEKERTGVGVKAGKRVVKTLVTNALSVIPGGQGINFAGEVIETCGALGKALWRRFDYWIQKDLGYFAQWEKDWKAKWHGANVGVNKIVRSWDPNEMIGPVGYGDDNYIGQTNTIGYRILFENKKEATAPAYRIRITDVLDEDVFDLTSVRFEGTSHDGEGYNWKMTQEGSTLSWDIEGIELPPNVNAPEGEGYVAFSVNLKPDLDNQTQIKNKATIIFDYNEPIETNEFVNTLDLMPPTATMLTASATGQDVTVKCSGRDGESGVGHYMFYAMAGDGEPMFIGDEVESQVIFTVPAGANPSDYKFYALAVDNVGNIQEDAPAAVSVSAGLKGDVNGDGEVTVADVNAIISVIINNTSNPNADVNGDGEISVADINTVISIILKG